MVSVLAIAGTLRSTSSTFKALRFAIEGVRAAGAELTLADFNQPPFPLFDSETSNNHPAVVQFKNQVRACDALLIATPVFHDSFTGVLKNALDHLQEELNEKFAGLIAIGGGRSGQSQALEHLRAVFRETGTWVLPRQVIITQAKYAFDETTGRPVDPEIEIRLKELGRELVHRTQTMRGRPLPPPAS